jgi:hypothetical protein
VAVSQLSLPRTVGPDTGRLRSAASSGRHLAWAALRRTILAAARLLGWLCADPGRPRAVFGGLALCVALGVGIGLAVGLITARSATLILSTVATQQR